ncbi:MAG TPA: CDP-alcohol phosphatidyltransferase family protein, partial [Verrucomicrobiota bacterium]|nr:CDP-alcohol phosphatidyltransferase family protein [Verrucomicrobiota bacterium]
GAMTMTTANKITIVRILMVPVFVVALLRYTSSGGEAYRWVALAVFVLAAAGDGVDGFVARRFDQRTEMGALLDPLADKLLLVLGLVVLSLQHSPRLDRIPLWLTGTVLCRDVILLLMLVLISYLVGRRTVRPRWTGKVATVLQMGCVLWALLKLDVVWLNSFAAAATACTAVSGIQYVRDGIRMLQSQPPQPTPPS